MPATEPDFARLTSFDPAGDATQKLRGAAWRRATNQHQRDPETTGPAAREIAGEDWGDCA